jgi:hypothetical protein
MSPSLEVWMEPCLACGELVHRVAGRCKHCRADLVALRLEAAKEARRRAAAAAATIVDAPAVTVTPEPTPLGRVPEQAAPASARRARTPMSRRMRLTLMAAIAVLVLGAGAAGGVLAQRYYGGSNGDAQAGEQDDGDDSPADHKPATADTHTSGGNPLSHMLGSKDPDPDPVDPTDPGDPDPAPQPQHVAPPIHHRSGGAPTIDQFGQQLGDTLCQKLTECGVMSQLGAGAADTCSMLAGVLQDPDAAEKVKNGECHYDASAAGACLDALDGMRCDAANADPSAMLALAEQMSSCTSAIQCN